MHTVFSLQWTNSTAFTMKWIHNVGTFQLSFSASICMCLYHSHIPLPILQKNIKSGRLNCPFSLFCQWDDELAGICTWGAWGPSGVCVCLSLFRVPFPHTLTHKATSWVQLQLRSSNSSVQLPNTIIGSSISVCCESSSLRCPAFLSSYLQFTINHPGRDKTLETGCDRHLALFSIISCPFSLRYGWIRWITSILFNKQRRKFFLSFYCGLAIPSMASKCFLPTLL